MKTSFILLFVLTGIFSLAASAQNLFPPNGNVGLGTGNPAYPLDVVGDVRINGNIGMGIAPSSLLPIQIRRNVGGTVGIRFENTNATSNSAFSALQMGQDINTTGTKFLNILYGNSGIGSLGFYQPLASTIVNVGSGGLHLATYDASGNGRIQFYTGNNVAAAAKMVIDEQGRVGIGTSAPNTFRLAVEGKIGARGVTVTVANPWPDYVFHSNYRLPSLKEVEAFIQQYHHLPEMPSAKEAEDNGIDLGSNQAALLKKVEELTLYIIDLNRRLEEQKALIEQQQKLIADQAKLVEQTREIKN